MTGLPDRNAEWLETDGLGGFASGTVSGPRSRRYHALLLAATQPPGGRQVLVNGLEVHARVNGREIALSTQRYAPGVLHPDGATRIVEFSGEPWPRWVYRIDGGLQIIQEIFVTHGSPRSVVQWRLARDSAPGAVPPVGAGNVELRVRPLLSGRDYHSLHHENGAFRFSPEIAGASLLWHPYDGVARVEMRSNGTYEHSPLWYRSFEYTEEAARGLDFTEDLASPGSFTWKLGEADAVLILEARLPGQIAPGPAKTSDEVAREARALQRSERERRAGFSSPLLRAADAYFVRRGGKGLSLVAGYPWFTDWGRDTFIALRGLALATGRRDDARRILLEWSGAVSEGMLPNRFTDSGETPEYNSVDASLWFVLAVGELLERGPPLAAQEQRRLEESVASILAGYAGGTRHGIRLDEDGLLLSGEPGLQLTWMDARVGDWVVTPRRGKPVEIQALWLNALAVGTRLARSAGRGDRAWERELTRGRKAFVEKYWSEERGFLCDVADVDGQAGVVDASFRPNQIFAAGGLPLLLLEPGAARRVVDAVEARLWTPLGLRSLAPGEPGYRARYEGGVLERDGSYHQGTVWPWLLGPFVEAWVKTRGGTREAKRAARSRFVLPLLEHLKEAGLGHVSEIADAEPPHTPRGCPFQAWSLGELLRLELEVLA